MQTIRRMEYSALVEGITRVTEMVGVVVLLIGGVIATAAFLREWARSDFDPAYTQYRANLGRSILLGLEILIVADIIRTIAVEPTIENVGVLALIVGIRTFLSFALEIEIGGTVPWGRTAADRASGHATGANQPDAARGEGLERS